jgi:hypothetical protein
MSNTRCHIFMLMLVSWPALCGAQHLQAKLENQFSGWAMADFTRPADYQLGGRYIPSLSVTDSVANGQTLSGEISINTVGSVDFMDNSQASYSGRIKPYRLWLRYAFPRLELRAGLQKINFGSASILRPMMWFDRIDVRDPLQLTDGVYCFLGRYYFQNNVNIWFWTLYGNDNTKGWETVPTKAHTPEFGGRIQLPVPKGEAAISYHHRKAAMAGDTINFISGDVYPEDRLGIDGKWDIGIGIWFEAVVKHNGINNPVMHTWETYLNLGMDYTFGLGNGLNVITEYFRYSNRAEFSGSGMNTSFSVLSANYPFGLMNTVTAMVYYNWDQRDWYRFISIQRKYDYLSLYLMAFWNPGQFNLYSTTQDRNLFAGKGIQVMAVVNI